MIDSILCNTSHIDRVIHIFLNYPARGLEGNESTIYWKCNVGVFVDEMLSIPISNNNKQTALHATAQLHLTAQEVSRRQVTGTLNSSSLLQTAINVLTLSDEDLRTSSSSKQKKKLVETVNINFFKLKSIIIFSLYDIHGRPGGTCYYYPSQAISCRFSRICAMQCCKNYFNISKIPLKSSHNL